MNLIVFTHRQSFCVVVIPSLFVLFFIYSIIKSQKPITKIDFENFQPIPLHINVSHSRKLFNLDFKYILKPDLCPDDLLAVIIVTSYYRNVETRSSMRRAFPQDYLNITKVRRFFLLGEGPDSEFITQASIINESQRFGDIIQGNFIEAYRNLTYKHIMGLKWVSENCKSTKYVIKMDDDIVFNINKTVKLLTSLKLPKKSIAGFILKNMTAIRNPANKWYVTEEEYKFPKYPSFVSGWFYITTAETASQLVLLSHYHNFFWIDDVFITGIIAQNSKVKLINLNKYFAFYTEFLQCCMDDLKKRLDCDFLIGPNGGNDNLFYEFNEAMKICEKQKCQKREKDIKQTCVAERKINLKNGNSIVENYKLH